MRLVTRKKDLLRATAAAGRAVSGRSTLPLLHNLLIEATGGYTDGRLTLTGTDLDTWVSASIACEVEQPGRTTLNARLLAEWCNALSDGHPVAVSAEEPTPEHEEVTFRHGRSRAVLYGLPAREFPAVPMRAEAQPFALLDARAFASAVGRVEPAASQDETRARLTGVQLIGEGNRLRLCATDTHRFATMTVPNLGEPHAADCILPRTAARMLASFADRGTALALYLQPFRDGLTDATRILAELHLPDLDLQVCARGIEGEFPNWRKVLSSMDPEFMIKADASGAREATRRAAIVSREDNRKLVLDVPLDTQAVGITARSSKIGHAREEVDAEVATRESEGLQIAFNSELLGQGLRAAGDDVQSALYTSVQPGIFRSQTDDYTYVLMPMQMG